MKFYIVTPTFNSLVWLRRCVRSVADQVGEGVEVHHHIQDGGSGDGTIEWLRAWQAEHADTAGYTLSIESAADEGMYDALNKAWDKMPDDAEITAHLNSDEQYLPGALAGIAESAKKNPTADLLLGAVFIVDAAGIYHCHRHSAIPHLWSSYLGCVNSTCVCFHRAASFRKYGVRFDTRLKSIGDVVFYRDIMRSKPRVELCNELFVAAYALTGKNLAWTDATMADWKIYGPTVPRWRKILQPFIQRGVNFGRYATGFFNPPPKSYDIYVGDNDSRKTFQIEKPTYRWRSFNNQLESETQNGR